MPLEAEASAPTRGDVWETGGVLVWLGIPSGGSAWHCLLIDLPDERVTWTINPRKDRLVARGVKSASEYREADHAA